MEKSIHYINPATTSKNGTIVLYDAAFNHPAFKTDRVIVHALAHAMYSNYSKAEIQSYELALKWKYIGGTYIRNGFFLSSNAQDSPAEDFAINIEFYLFENLAVKSKLPEAYNWIQKKYTKDFKPKEACYDK